jgi:type II secretory pathway predicted ATPase ExeA
MYEASFEFHSRPFAPTPRAAAYFPAAGIENARQTLARLIERGEGPGLVTGPPGVGKTLLCQVLAEQFRERFAVVVLSGARLKTLRAMLQAILYELRLPYRGVSEGELRLTLLDYLEPKPGGSEGLLLVVDEAHTLPFRLLDEVRLMTNLVREGEPRVRAILAGAAVLEERFASQKLDSFSQRLAGRCYLGPLDGAETAQYVRSQLAAAGGEAARLVDEAALRSIYRATDGIPRLVNQVCDHALMLVGLAGGKRLTSEAIEEAWADLQQLPPPWTPAAEEEEAKSQIVEFGHLEDDGDLAAAIPFRAAAHDAAHPLDAGAPDDQLEAIAHQLAAMDVPIELPAASVAADLDFPEFGDPFDERFAEEEVVVDPYSTGVEIFADVPRVNSWEGRQLSSLLDDAGPTQPWANPRPDVKLSEPIVEPAAAPHPAQDAAAWQFSPASDPVLPDESGDESFATRIAPPEAAPRREPAPQPQSPEKLAGVASDRDVIVVVEETRAVVAPPPTAPKGEFRQLFAKLRRG